MKRGTVVVTLALFSVIAGVVGFGGVQVLGSDGSLSEQWTTDTARDTLGNHHLTAVDHVDGRTLLIVPVNANADGDQTNQRCTLYALTAQLEERWRATVPPADCNVHAFGDPTIADLNGDGDDEVFVATTEGVVRAFDARTGDEAFRHELSGWGYAAPVVADFTPAPGRELVVADLNGGVFVFDGNGTVRWNRQFSTIVAQIAVADFDADGTPELGLGEGKNVTVLDPDGTVAWQTPLGGSVNWLTTGRTADGGTALVAATIDGRVVAVDGRTGDVEWSRQFNTLAAVHAFGDGDGDGTPEVYAVAQDGILRSLDADTGATEWTTTLTTESVQMTPPPAMGDLDGDGDRELVAVSQDGVVSVVNATSGAVVDSHERSVPIWTRPTLVDLDGDGTLEIVIGYGDGRVTAFSFDAP